VLSTIYGTVCVPVGGFIVASYLRHRRYIKGLPPSPGNRQLHGREPFFLVIGIGLVFVGLWQFVRGFGL
jgi:hypothetical protein